MYVIIMKQAIFALESVVHALSALGRDLPGLLPTHELARMVTALPALPPHPGKQAKRLSHVSVSS